MCLIFLSINHHPKYKLIVAGNRDEFYNRRTAAASFWEDHPAVLAGRDLEAFGTWLGMTAAGRVAMLTNFRDPKNINPVAPSRGQLVSDFLLQHVETEQYMKAIYQKGKAYNGFNLITGTVDELWYYSNYSEAPRRLTNGTYGLSNHLLDTPWPKVTRGKQRFMTALQSENPDPEKLFQILYDEETAPDDQLPQTGLTPDREKALSSMFIKTNGYGSRCTTVIMVDRDNNTFFAERVFNTDDFTFQTQVFEFRLQAD
jgi:uncharacterized protein with NRDE domain